MGGAVALLVAVLAVGLCPADPISSVASNCMHSSIDNCRLVDADDPCRCPCLPKCCPAGHVLAEGGLGQHHGVDCVPAADAGSGLPLPSVRMTGRLANVTGLRFYNAVFPLCEGIEAADWRYDVHREGSFTLDADFQQEYVLHVTAPEKEAVLVSNFENSGERGAAASARGSGGDHIVGFKPLMYFCFERLSNDTSVTVAVTCPRVPLTSARKIHKCCPPGQTIADPTLSACSERKDPHRPWHLPINGHLHSEKDLEAKGVLVYDRNMALILSEVTKSRCENLGLVRYEEYDAFHVGPDARIHFTDTHLAVSPMENYCVEQLYHEPIDESEPMPDYSHYFEEDYVAEEEAAVAKADPNKTDSQHQLYQRMANYNCHNEENKPHAMVAFYCKDQILQLRKCCDKGHNLNLRARLCTPDLAKDWAPPPTYSLDQVRSQPVAANASHINTLYSNIMNMERGNLYVTQQDFHQLITGELWFNGKKYNASDYCLDYSIDWCSRHPSAELRAIINDPDLKEDTATAIFGTNKEDSKLSHIIKQVGFPVSAIFLVITLAVYIIVPELRRDMHGKMVLGIVSSQTLVYIFLFVGTFPPAQISRSSFVCVAQAALTYYFILCSFLWMSAMSYNIMTKFRASIILPKNADRRRFVAYCAFCYGLAFVMFAAVVAVDQSRGLDDGDIPSPWRPGFGEESCWFSSCSRALTVFLYGPIIVLLLFNISMFSFAAVKLFQLQKRASVGQRESYNKRDSEAENRATKTSSKLPRSFSKVTSTLSRKRSKFNANKESFLTYLKLFVAMGLTWAIEILAWILSDNNKPAPQAIIILLNLMNIFQGIVIFSVFTLKPSTVQKLREKLAKSKGGDAAHSTAGRPGGPSSTGSTGATSSYVPTALGQAAPASGRYAVCSDPDPHGGETVALVNINTSH